MNGSEERGETPPPALARVVRAGLEESVHRADVVVVDPNGRLVASAGDPGRLLFARSSMKPLQAAVSLSHAAFDFTDREVAVMCASHNAEPVHIEAVRGILRRAGVEESALLCPSVRPWDDEALGTDPERRRINSDCSGKHAGMLAACRAAGWPRSTYRSPDHPLQRSIERTVLDVIGSGSVRIGIDGCGVPVHGMPIASMARIYASFGDPERFGPVAPHARRAVEAMRAEPYLVAGRNRPDTAIMEAAPHVIAKGGAEGLMCAAVLDRSLGVAVKIRDGSSRAAGAVLIEALRVLDVLDAAVVTALGPFATPPVLGGGEPVGSITVELDLR